MSFALGTNPSLFSKIVYSRMSLSGHSVVVGVRHPLAKLGSVALVIRYWWN